jgi:hypothetical protein
MMPRTVVRMLLLVLAVWTVTHCGGSGSSSTTGPSSTTTDPCAGVLNQYPGPSTENAAHRMFMATTRDGLTLTDAHLILDHADVGDGTLLPDGSAGIYYGDVNRGVVSLARLASGIATPVGDVSIDGKNPPLGFVDPDAQLVSGKVRLFYKHGLPNSSAVMTCSAESSDGLNFQSTGLAISNSVPFTDPSVTPLAGGRWLMGLSQGQSTWLADSSNGLSYSLFGSRLDIGGVPELTLLADGRLRMYVCHSGNIDAYISGDAAGSSWTFERTVILAGPAAGGSDFCDPSLIKGTDTFLFTLRKPSE